MERAVHSNYTPFKPYHALQIIYFKLLTLKLFVVYVSVDESTPYSTGISLHPVTCI